VWKVVRATTATGTLEMSTDTFPTVTLANHITDSAPPIRDLAFGIGFAGSNVNDPQPAFDLWIDDLITDSAPVTCAD